MQNFKFNLFLLPLAPKNGLLLTFDDFEDALHTFKPVSVRHIQLHKPGELGWSDVGGLAHVKTSLEETLKWPSKVGHILFGKQCYQALQSPKLP